MEELKSIFGESSLSYDEFNQKLEEAGDTIKLANLKSGNYVDKDKYDKLEKDVNDWKDKFSSLTEKTKDYDDLKTNYETLNNNYAELQKKQNETERFAMVKDANVDNNFVKFVYSEVSSQMVDGKDFKTALTEYLKDNTQYLKGRQGNYANLENGNTPPKTANQKMNDFIRRK